MSDSLWPLKSTRLFCPWDSPGKNTEVGCHFLLQGIFPTQGLMHSMHLLHWQVDFFILTLNHQRSPLFKIIPHIFVGQEFRQELGWQFFSSVWHWLISFTGIQRHLVWSEGLHTASLYLCNLGWNEWKAEVSSNYWPVDLLRTLLNGGWKVIRFLIWWLRAFIWSIQKTK